MGNNINRGSYFKVPQQSNTKIYSYNEVKANLPSPILPKTDWVEAYHNAVEVAFSNCYEPTEKNKFVSNYLDAAFNKDVFLWDTVFITMFGDLLAPFVPGIQSLDNFYNFQLDDGSIPREFVRDTGEDFQLWVNHRGLPLHSFYHNHYGYRRLASLGEIDPKDMMYPDLEREQTRVSHYTLDNLNHPLMAWAELISYRHTGNIERLAAVYKPLVKHYFAFKELLRHKNNLYVTDWASMDNSPRNKYLGCGVDISSEMALLCENIIELSEILDKGGLVKKDEELCATLKKDYEDTKAAINELLWDEEQGFYFDLCVDGTHAPTKTIAAFWTLISGVASKDKVKRLVDCLNDKNTFNRIHRVPTCSADAEGYETKGGYWRGGVWAPTNAMVVMGLEKVGEHLLAREIALNHLDCIAKIYMNTGHIWEYYPPDFIDKGDNDHKDFVGWTGIGPIRYVLEYAVGLVADAAANTLYWEVDTELLSMGEIGCKSYRFANITTDLLIEKNGTDCELTVSSDKEYKLHLKIGTANHVIDVTDGIALKHVLR